MTRSQSQQPGFDNSYVRLGESHSTACAATPVTNPGWMAWNENLADTLDWPTDWRKTDEALQSLSGNTTLPGMAPLATVYAGHQFGSYNPQLGDGRALLLGEWLNAQGQRFDIQLKGAGPTPFSRGGDGRSPVGPVVREYLMSEAMFALGVPTTRALAAVATGERVFRQSAEPGAILTRVAQSHLRVGTVQYFAMSNDGEGVEELVDHVVDRHYREALSAARNNDPSYPAARVLLRESAKRLAVLVAQWQSLGFIHGVLNTDNMLLSGETIDYGPCAFMDGYAADRVFSSIDTQGRYAYRNQPGIVHWNLSVLANCLMPLLADDQDDALAFAQREVDQFPEHFAAAQGAFLAAKFGFAGFSKKDQSLVEGFFTALAQDELDLTLAFRWLTETAASTVDQTPLPELFVPNQALIDWTALWRQRRSSDEGRTNASEEESLERMRAVNPAVIPRNHQVARAIAAADQQDYTVLHDLCQRWQAPYAWASGDEVLAAGPAPEQAVTRTFCGT